MGTMHIIWKQETMERVWERYGILDG